MKLSNSGGLGKGIFKRDNSTRGKSAKMTIRQNVADAIGAPLHVFDAFAGAGEIHKAIWKERSASYTGCDLRQFHDGRRMFVADNRRVLRAIDLAVFNIFDIDAYASPWEQALIITARRKLGAGERIGIIVTEGNGISYRYGVVPHAVSALIGLRHRSMPGAVMNQRREELQEKIWMAIAGRMHASVERLWKAGGDLRMAVAYMGAVLRGNPVAVQAKAVNDTAVPAMGCDAPVADRAVGLA